MTMRARYTVALADDDEIQSELVATWLETRGYHVLRFRSGDELVEWASAGADAVVDAFLLDVDMPGRDGFQSCRELRSLPVYSGTPALFVSSSCLGGDERVLGVRASGAIPKDPEMLGRIAEWLERTLVPRPPDAIRNAC